MVSLAGHAVLYATFEPGWRVEGDEPFVSVDFGGYAKYGKPQD